MGKKYKREIAKKNLFEKKNKFAFKRDRILKSNKDKFFGLETDTVKKIPLLIVVKVTANNIFCVFSKFKKKETLFLASSGKFKIRTSKRKLKLSIKLILKKFILRIRRVVKQKLIIIRVKSPKKIKKIILRYFIRNLKKTKRLILQIVAKKTFNGCRVQKKRRKKRKGLRVFKF
jgi:hypothetical protein